jgi:hypothetical protein
MQIRKKVASLHSRFSLKFVMRISLVLIFTWICLTVQAQDTGPNANAANVPTDRHKILQLQIFMDHHLFGPGKLDGAIGEFTYKAIVNYNFARGHKDIYNWSYALAEAEREDDGWWWRNQKLITRGILQKGLSGAKKKYQHDGVVLATSLLSCEFSINP